MLFEEDTKDPPPSNIMLTEEALCDREVYLSDSCDRELDEKEPVDGERQLLPNSSSRIDEVSRAFLPDVFFPECPLQQPSARFAWSEDDTIASFVSRAAFGAGDPEALSEELDFCIKDEIKEEVSSDFMCDDEDPTVVDQRVAIAMKTFVDSDPVSSTSSGIDNNGYKPFSVDQTDCRTRLHYIKYVKRSEQTVRVFECGICSREFQHQYTLMRHMPTHTDERKYVCKVCGKSFRQLSTLSQHRSIHSSKRPYICEVCKKTFNRVSTLISHRKTHSDDKPFKCHFCFRGFHQKGNLRHHMFTHTNERPYRCNVCFRGFNQQSNLVCHKNKAHALDMNVQIQEIHKTYRTFGELLPAVELKPEPERPSSDESEISSTVGPCQTYDGPSTSGWTPNTISQELPMLFPAPDSSGGVIVDSINTYHMELAHSTKQIPFALLKANENSPVLVKVMDTNLIGGKQMLLPATAADLRDGGQIVVFDENGSEIKANESMQELSGAIHIRVPVVATVVPRVSPGGLLELTVEEPQLKYYTAVTTDSFQSSPTVSPPPPAPAPPLLDVIPPMELFEPVQNMPMEHDNSENYDAETDSGGRTDKLDDIENVPFWVLRNTIRDPQITAVETPKNSPEPDDEYN